jgi:para-aminobenzoate synthetase component 1
MVFQSRGEDIEISAGGYLRRLRGNPFQVLDALLRRYKVQCDTGGPPLTCGAVGYLGYGLRQFVERVPVRASDDTGLPDCWLGFYDAVAAIDHLSGRVFVCSSGLPECDVHAAQTRFDWLAELVRGAEPTKAQDAWPETGPGLSISSNFTRDSYVAAVARAKEYIAAGDIYQVNLSQRLYVETDFSDLQLYRRLRMTHAAPFSAFLPAGGISVLCASPESFLRVRGRHVITRPIKGTRPRGRTPEEDEQNARELLASAKDRAENVMIVDLERNDLGRVCRFGTVRATSTCALESYSSVFHLVSTVEGELREDKGCLDLVRACFPGGSVTGAPKVRAMGIIDELEPTARGIYTGSLGYICFCGDMDLNIIIRTLVLRGRRCFLHVGGGIVADSDPEAEYQETLDKARGLLEAAALLPRSSAIGGTGFQPAHTG